MRRRTYGATKQSRKQAVGALSMLLYGCKGELLTGFTAAGLASSYNVKVETAERMLADARRMRAA